MLIYSIFPLPRCHFLFHHFHMCMTENVNTIHVYSCKNENNNITLLQHTNNGHVFQANFYPFTLRVNIIIVCYTLDVYARKWLNVMLKIGHDMTLTEYTQPDHNQGSN